VFGVHAGITFKGRSLSMVLVAYEANVNEQHKHKEMLHITTLL
jgi:hypothetical protein